MQTITFYDSSNNITLINKKTPRCTSDHRSSLASPLTHQRASPHLIQKKPSTEQTRRRAKTNKLPALGYLKPSDAARHLTHSRVSRCSPFVAARRRISRAGKNRAGGNITLVRRRGQVVFLKTRVLHPPLPSSPYLAASAAREPSIIARRKVVADPRGRRD